MFDWSILPTYGESLAKGFGTTLSLALLGNGVAVVLGLLICLVRMRWFVMPLSDALSRIALLWIELFRNLPLLFQVLFFYYIFQLGGYWAALLGLCTYTSAFMAETFRAGFNTVPREELQEARYLGLTPVQQLTEVLLPRSLEVNTSSLATQMMNLTKNTSIAYFVAVGEMTYTFESLSSQTYHFLEFFAIALASYVGLCFLIALAARTLENALRKRFRRSPTFTPPSDRRAVYGI